MTVTLDTNQRKMLKLYEVLSACGSLNQLHNIIDTNELMNDEVANCLKQMSEVEKCISHMTDSPPIIFKLSYVGKNYQLFSGVVFEVSCEQLFNVSY